MRKITKIVAIITAIGSMLFLTSCGAKYATSEEIETYAVKLVKGENIRCVGETEKKKFRFSSKDRNLEFDVWSVANSINIDGANFGYTGDYTIRNNYLEKVNLFYENRVYDMMKKYGFDNYKKSDTYTSLRYIEFCIPENCPQQQKDDINAFISELQSIVSEEKQCHTSDIYDQYTAMYNIELIYKTTEGYYRRTSGINTNSYSTNIFDDDTVYVIKNI